MVTKPVGVAPPAAEGQQEPGSDRAKESLVQGPSRGPRKQLTVTMAGRKVLDFCSFHILRYSPVGAGTPEQCHKSCLICATRSRANVPLQGKRVVSEKAEKKPLSVDATGPAGDGQATSAESPGRGKQPPHVSKLEPLAQVGIVCTLRSHPLPVHSTAH